MQIVDQGNKTTFLNQFNRMFVIFRHKFIFLKFGLRNKEYIVECENEGKMHAGSASLANLPVPDSKLKNITSI